MIAAGWKRRTPDAVMSLKTLLQDFGGVDSLSGKEEACAE